MSKLTAKQSRFVEEYLIDLNATQAAIRAGYSAKRADSIGHENLRKPDISQAVQAAMAERGKRAGITQDQVLEDVEAIKRDAMTRIADKEGNLVMANHSAALKAAELQGKHLGMFTDRLALSGVVAIAKVQRTVVDPK